MKLTGGMINAIPKGRFYWDELMKLETKNYFDRKSSRASAFTLPEVLISIVLVSIVIVSLYGGITQGLVTVDVGRDNMRATQVMVNTMEVIRLYNWDQINAPGFIPTNFVINLYPTNTVGAVDSTATRLASTETQASQSVMGNRKAGVRIKVEPPAVGGSYSNNMREITVTLTWTNQNVVRSRSMKSFVAQEGIQQYVYEN